MKGQISQQIEKEVLKRYDRRDRKKAPKMKISGWSVFGLKKILIQKSK